ncbi:MAG: hypothetical protein IPK57_18205 [Chitinophagaceae bacterium]|nr:hypothetical protein [Chitinophagaceae bacterium]
MPEKSTFFLFLFKKNGLELQHIYSFNNDQFFIYGVNNHFIPNESFTAFISYETQLEKCKNESLFTYQPRRGEIVLDLGAVLGEETLYYSQLVGHKGRVLAIEANPAVFEVLKKLLRLINSAMFPFLIWLFLKRMEQ